MRQYGTGGRVEDLLEGLVQKIEGLSRKKQEDLESSRQALASADRLIEAMNRLQAVQKREKSVARKVAAANLRLEKASELGRGMELKSLGETFGKILSGAKTTGQVIEITAGSLQVMVETIRAVLKNQTPVTRAQSPESDKNSVDLAALMKPLSSLLNTLMAAAPKETHAPARQKTEVDSRQPSKMETSPVTVVRGVPLEDPRAPEKE